MDVNAPKRAMGLSYLGEHPSRVLKKEGLTDKLSERSCCEFTEHNLRTLLIE
jgi:hypothetical protein